MNTKSAMTLERALQIYSVDSREWWDGTGDTDQMLGVREWIEERIDNLSALQLDLLRSADGQVLKLAEQFQIAKSMDISMLHRVADIVNRHHAMA